ncbi:nucleoside deaminase [Fructilactobacillus fructivorans]|uniref:nucleoside deaminase n=1 Tax=Fructilactobacillus fructivorans TaxID=1614 RepID=UPI0007055219|nr:nucleoside deaminase [Fructilactobacillus fructivorans]
MNKNDAYFMDQALIEANHAAIIGEVPIGAVIVQDDQIVGRGHNLREHTEMGTEHAEIVAIEEACANLKSWRLNDCEMFVTVEPCLMCAGAIINTRIKRLVYGSKNENAGAVESLYHTLNDSRQNHQVRVSSGLRAAQAGAIMKKFFKDKRKYRK